MHRALGNIFYTAGMSTCMLINSDMIWVYRGMHFGHHQMHKVKKKNPVVKMALT